MNAKEVFEKEWSLYRGGIGDKAGQSGHWGFADRRGSEGGDFDGDAKAGEYRIFADMPKPFVALVVEDRGMAGWLIVPVSPFTVPASTRETLVGERVLQLWNACVASRQFVERSWRVDEASAEDIEDVAERLAKVAVGRIAAGDGPVAEYERTFLVSGGNFTSPIAWGARKIPSFAWRRYGAWSVAAMLMVCLGTTWILHQERERPHDVVRNEAPRAEVIRHVEVCDTERRQSLCMEPTVMIKSPVVMKSMCGSRAPGSIGKFTCGGAYPEPERWRNGTERYAEFRENEFLDPVSEPLSTFSLDVDTSSYTLMRRYLVDQKTLPPKESVRLEEYVNYFHYGYAQPKGDDPVAVDCELGECPWNKSHRLLRLGVQAKRLEGDRLPPCNLTFLVDRSGSMNVNNGMEMLKSGLRMLVAKLRDEDHVSIVTYASGTEVLLRSTPGSDRALIAAAVDSLHASGGTYGSAGIQLAYEEAARNFDKKANNRVILVTDGDFNIGISSPRELEDFIASKRSSGIFLSVIGVGHGNYQDARMKKLANAGNGNYAYLDSVLEAKKVMMAEFGGTLFTVAKDVKVQVEFNPAQVSGYRLLGYENRLLKAKDFNDDRKDAGEIGSGHSMTAFYEIVPAGSGESVGASVDPLKYQRQTPANSAELFTVKTRWKAPDGDTSKLKEVACIAADITRAEASEDFRFASAVAEFALLLEDSKFKGDASFADVLRRARGAKGADEEGYRAEFIRLVETAELLKASPKRDAGCVPVEVDI